MNAVHCHIPQAVLKHPINVLLQSCSVINFFDAYAPRYPGKPSLPPRVADFIHRMNQHPHFLGVLGILPNQLRSLLKESGHEHREEFLLDLSQTLFFAGYRIWKKRQKLSLRYWKEVGQRQQEGITKRKKQKRKNMEEKMSESKCRNPFHYLHRHSNFSKQRPTRCPCKNVVDSKKVYVNQHITDFVAKFPKNVHNSDPRTKVLRNKSAPSSQKKFYTTRTDEIRKEHDRNKKRPLKQSTLQVTTKTKKPKR